MVAEIDYKNPKYLAKLQLLATQLANRLGNSNEFKKLTDTEVWFTVETNVYVNGKYRNKIWTFDCVNDFRGEEMQIYELP